MSYKNYVAQEIAILAASWYILFMAECWANWKQGRPYENRDWRTFLVFQYRCWGACFWTCSSFLIIDQHELSLFIILMDSCIIHFDFRSSDVWVFLIILFGQLSIKSNNIFEVIFASSHMTGIDLWSSTYLYILFSFWCLLGYFGKSSASLSSGFNCWFHSDSLSERCDWKCWGYLAG